MQSMVNRWRDKLTSIQQKQSIVNNPGAFPPKPQPTTEIQSNPHPHPNAHINTNTMSNSQMKRSVEKGKKSVHQQKQKISSSKRLTTPNKSKRNLKNKLIQRSCEQIFEIFAKATASDKTTSTQIKSVLEELWRKCMQTSSEITSPVHQSSTHINSATNVEQQASMMKQSNVSLSVGKKQEKLYKDLEKRYFQIEKQKQYYKSKIDEFAKKYELVEKQLQKYHKMQRLIDKCLEREQQIREQNIFLKNRLKSSQLELVEQQKIFQSEIVVVRELVDEIKKNLPQT